MAAILGEALSNVGTPSKHTVTGRDGHLMVHGFTSSPLFSALNATKERRHRFTVWALG